MEPERITFHLSIRCAYCEMELPRLEASGPMDNFAEQPLVARIRWDEHDCPRRERWIARIEDLEDYVSVLESRLDPEDTVSLEELQ